MKPSEYLKAAREVLVTKGWTKGAFARDAQGNKVPYFDDKACQFCVIGALQLVSYTGQDYVHKDWARNYLDKACAEPVANFNDHCRNIEQVLALYGVAIAKAEKDGR